MSISRTAVATLIVALGLGACGGNNAVVPPTSPTAAQSVGTVTIYGPSFVYLGESTHLEVETTAPDGTTVHPDNVTWSVDSPSVLSVSITGDIRGLQAGNATVRSDVLGRRAAIPVRVIPNYGGTWSGDYQLTFCRARRCDPLGQHRPLMVSLQQDKDYVQGVIDIGGDTAGNVRGTIAIDGRLTLDGVWDPKDPLGPFEWKSMLLYEWSTILVPGDLQRMTGTVRYGIPDYAEIGGTITSLVK